MDSQLSNSLSHPSTISSVPLDETVDAGADSQSGFYVVKVCDPAIEFRSLPEFNHASNVAK